MELQLIINNCRPVVEHILISLWGGQVATEVLIMVAMIGCGGGAGGGHGRRGDGDCGVGGRVSAVVDTNVCVCVCACVRACVRACV